MVSTWEGGGSGDGRRDEGGDWPDLVECRRNPLSPLSDLTSAPEPGGDTCFWNLFTGTAFPILGQRKSVAEESVKSRPLESPWGGLGSLPLSPWSWRCV